MLTTQIDFDILVKAFKNNNNIEEVKSQLQNFDVTATNSDSSNCLMLACRYSSSPEVVNLIFAKIAELGDTALIKSQLTATDRFRRTCLMTACASSSSPAVVKLIFDKIVEVGGFALLRSQLTATDQQGATCLMLCGYWSESPEVVKLFAVVLFHFDLFKEQYSKLHDDDQLYANTKKPLKEKAGIDSCSWAPDAASLAEVKTILQGATSAAKKKAEQEAVAKKKAEEEAATKKKAEEEAAAKKKSEEEEEAAEKAKSSQEQQQDQTTIDVVITTDSPPPTSCFKRGVPPKNLQDSINALMSIKEAPENRPDLNDWIPDKHDCDSLLHYLNTSLKELKDRPAVQKLIAENGLTDDDIRVLHSYKVQNPYPVYLWLNGWLGGDRRDDFVKQNVAPFFVLLYRAMEKLPRVKTVANRAIKVNGIASLKNTYDNYEKVCAPERTLSFWGFSSFSTKSDVINREEFVGKPSEEAIVYSCGALEGVDMEPFAPKGLKDESEILPLCPCVLEVLTAFKIGQKVAVAVKQADHSKFAYVAPK